jgi:anti-sigma regulatory factor (Ser/Thr protein kinase)
VTTSRIVLAPVSSSVPTARKFVAEELSDLPASTVEVARLLVSELVTNAVLHAGTEVEVSLDFDETGVNVEVADSNPHLPVIRDHSTEAGTGRGLHVVDQMASRWGARNIDTGKVVWFEIRNPADTAKQKTDVASHPQHGDPGDVTKIDRRRELRGDYGDNVDLVSFSWLGLPLQEIDRTAEHYDSVLREFHLFLARRPSERGAVPGRLISLMDEITQFAPVISVIERDVEEGRRKGAATIDVALELPREVATIALRLDNLLDEADAYCSAGVELLNLKPPMQVVALRKWMIGELVRQAEGHPPVTWNDSPWKPNRNGG